MSAATKLIREAVERAVNSMTADRFFSYVEGGDWNPFQCWEWMGGRNVKGYGVFALTHHEQVRAHRFAFRLFNGTEAANFVLHTCDNPPCVNPAHLLDGTHTDNMRHMAAHRRATRGESHHKAKIKFPTAVAITLLHRSGDYSTREIAQALGISQPTVAQIINGRLWPDAFRVAGQMEALNANS